MQIMRQPQPCQHYQHIPHCCRCCLCLWPVCSEHARDTFVCSSERNTPVTSSHWRWRGAGSGNVSYSLLCIICVPNENFIDISNANRYNTIVFAFWPNFGHICTAAQKTPFRPYNTILYYTSSCV